MNSPLLSFFTIVLWEQNICNLTELHISDSIQNYFAPLCPNAPKFCYAITCALTSFVAGPPHHHSKTPPWMFRSTQDLALSITKYDYD